MCSQVFKDIAQALLPVGLSDAESGLRAAALHPRIQRAAGWGGIISRWYIHDLAIQVGEIKDRAGKVRPTARRRTCEVIGACLTWYGNQIIRHLVASPGDVARAGRAADLVADDAQLIPFGT